MENNSPVKNCQIIGMIENFHLLRKLFIRRSTSSSSLHFGQVAIMRMIAQNENCTQATLAEQLSVTPASVATSTKRLERSGFITKTVDEHNLRCKRLALTDKGRETIENHRQVFEEYDSLIFSILSEEEKQSFCNTLSRLVSKMRELEGIDDEELRNPIELTVFLRKAMGTFIPENGSSAENNKKE